MIFSVILIGLGVVLWFWGSLCLAGSRSYFRKIHALGVSDTIGTLFILFGVLLHSARVWPHLVLAVGSVVFWGTAMSMVLARLGGKAKGGQ